MEDGIVIDIDAYNKTLNVSVNKNKFESMINEAKEYNLKERLVNVLQKIK